MWTLGLVCTWDHKRHTWLCSVSFWRRRRTNVWKAHRESKPSLFCLPFSLLWLRFSHMTQSRLSNKWIDFRCSLKPYSASVLHSKQESFPFTGILSLQMTRFSSSLSGCCVPAAFVVCQGGSRVYSTVWWDNTSRRIKGNQIRTSCQLHAQAHVKIAGGEMTIVAPTSKTDRV